MPSMDQIGNLHVWRRTTDGAVDYLVSVSPDAYQAGSDAKPAGYTLQAEQAVSRFDAYRQKFYVMDTLMVDEDGNFIADGDVVSYAAMSSSAKGKYIYSQPSAPLVYYVPSDATITPTVYGSNCYISISKAQRAIGYPAIPANTTIEYLGQLGDKTRIVTGSYVGTGTFGTRNPTKISLPSKAKVLVILASEHLDFYNGRTDDSFVLISTTDTYTVGDGSGSSYDLIINWNDDGISMVLNVGESAEMQFNGSGVKYTYFAIM